jgi:hypothetical protein
MLSQCICNFWGNSMYWFCCGQDDYSIKLHSLAGQGLLFHHIKTGSGQTTLPSNRYQDSLPRGWILVLLHLLMRLRLRAVTYLFPPIFAVLWPSYVVTISSKWQSEGDTLFNKVWVCIQRIWSLLSFLVLPSNPLPFQIIFSALKIVCSLMESVALLQV